MTISDLRQSIIECRETIESKVLKIRQFETKVEMLQGVLTAKIHVLNLKTKNNYQTTNGRQPWSMTLTCT